MATAEYRPPSQLPTAAFPLEAWRQGWAHFRAGAFFAAHESWEECWRTLPRDAPEARLLQALILLAAVRLKQDQGRLVGADRLAARASALAASLPPSTAVAGFDTPALHRLWQEVVKPGTAPR